MNIIDEAIRQRLRKENERRERLAALGCKVCGASVAMMVVLQGQFYIDESSDPVAFYCQEHIDTNASGSWRA